jgi:thiamine biosynthesis lipoprotein ApbE
MSPATATWPALGSTAHLVVTDTAALGDAIDAVREEVAAIDLACSRFREDSELQALNRAGGRPFRAGPVLLEAVAVALRAAAETDGAVDPTMGRTLCELGWDRDFDLLDEHAGPAVVHVRRSAGWRAVEINGARGTIRLPAGVALDLGATAKALCADRAARAAAERTGAGVLVSLGGDVAVAGPVPGEGWPVRVTDDHRSGPDAAGQTVAIFGGGLATSSTRARRWRRGGRDLHHILDPQRGLPAPERWRTVSVAAASCLAANTASTAAIVRGRGAAAWLAGRGLAARLVARDGATLCVAGWPEDAR